MNCSLFNGRIKLDFKFDEQLKQKLKDEIIGRKYHPEGKFWSVPYTRASVEWLRKQGFNFMFQPQFNWLNFKGHSDLNATLREYQREGVEFMINSKKCINGIFPGGGKTIQTICSLDYLKGYPAIIVTITSTKVNWKREYEKFLPNSNLKIWIVSGLKTEPPLGYDIYIVNYNLLRKDSLPSAFFKEKLKPRAIILDESHNIKNAKTGWTKELREIKKAAKPEIIYLLTGTAVKNRPSELIEQLKFIDKLDEFGGYTRFIYQYCDAKKTRFGFDVSGATNLDELYSILRATCYFRYERDEVLQELPDLEEIDLWVDAISPEYKKIENEIIDFYKNKKEAGVDFYKKISTMSEDERELYLETEFNAEYSDSAGNGKLLGFLAALKKQIAEDKALIAEDWIKEYIQERPSQPLLVFGWHKSPLIYLSKVFNSGLINGSTPEKQRNRLIDDFQQGKSNLLFLNIQAGGTGINLTRAATILMLELPWETATHEQVISRMRRIGNTNSKLQAYNLLAQDSTDDYVHTMLKLKGMITDSILAGKQSQQELIDIYKLLQKMFFRKALKLDLPES